MQALYQLSYSPLFCFAARFPRRRRKHYRSRGFSTKSVSTLHL
ncbi:hypothetical protein SGPA1_30507 [Streptomyces misionensis JCM 4497]